MDDLQVPSSAPGKARFFGLFSFFTLVRLVRMCKSVILSGKCEFYIHGSGTLLSAEVKSPPLPHFINIKALVDYDKGFSFFEVLFLN